MNVLFVVMSVAAILAVALGVLFRRMASRYNASSSPAEWLTDFSVAAYAPMERLLDERDFAFIAAQAGYAPGIVRRLRAERKEIFKGYLRRLVRDFNQLHAIAKLMIVYGDEDRLDFARSVWRRQITFYVAVSMLRCRLALYPMITGSWDVGNLVGALENMRDGLNEFALPARHATL
jgi:hypothetical protein